MHGIEHIIRRHSFNSSASNVSRFAEVNTRSDIRQMVGQALRDGSVVRNGEANAFAVTHDFGRTIGTTIDGEAARIIQVFVRDGVINTAFPF